jgi:hypothetical protein
MLSGEDGTKGQQQPAQGNALGWLLLAFQADYFRCV